MEKKSIWRLVVQIVGLALALAGIIFLLIAHWDKLTACVASLRSKCKSACSCAESEDYADELLYE